MLYYKIIKNSSWLTDTNIDTVIKKLNKDIKIQVETVAVLSTTYFIYISTDDFLKI